MAKYSRVYIYVYCVLSSPAEISAVYLVYKIVIQSMTIQSQLSKQLLNGG